jgi:hypothetical protein
LNNNRFYRFLKKSTNQKKEDGKILFFDWLFRILRENLQKRRKIKKNMEFVGFFYFVMIVRSYSVAPKNDKFSPNQFRNFALKIRGICRVFNIFCKIWKIGMLIKPF